MKKVYLIGAVALLAAVGCNKELSDGYAPTGSVILKASVETDATKVGAVIDKEDKTVSFVWTNGDAVAVQAEGSFETFALVGNGGTTTGDFSGDVQPSLGAVAVFPAATAKSVAGNDLTLDLPAEYTYAEGQTNALMFATVKEENKMFFKHLGGILQVKMQGIPERAVKCVVIAEGKKINGEYTVDYTAEEPFVALANATKEAESTVTVKLAETVTDLTLNIPLPVGDYPSLSICLLDASGAVINGSLIETTTTKSIARKTLKAMPGVVLSIKDFFLTPNGNGDKTGADWENAMDFSTFANLVSHDYHGALTADECAALDGATFHVAGGKYIMTTDAKDRFKLQFTNYGKPCNIAFIGGYDPNSTGKDLSKRNTATFETKFTGDKDNNNQADQSDLGVFCVDSWAFVNFDGITFCYVGGKSQWRQGAFVCNSDSNKLAVTLNNCKFTDIYSSTHATHGKGAAFYLFGNSTIKATKCTFNNCTSYLDGGAICLAGNTSTVELSECEFTDCKSTTGMGGAIAMNAGGKVMASGCTFTRCSAASGGAIIMTSGGEMSLDNSVFDACSTTSEHGAAIKLTNTSPVLKLNACVFKNGDPKQRAGAIYQDSKSVLFMNACSFFNNKTNATWGTAIQTNSNMLMSNCTFGENTGGGNIINGGGNWLIANTTAISSVSTGNEARNAAFRYTGSGVFTVVNTVALYTQSEANKGGIYSESNVVNSYGYNTYDKATKFTAITNSDNPDQTMTSLGLVWNNGGYYSWNGPSADMSKAKLSDVETAIKTGCQVEYGKFSDLGQSFYDWLQEIGDGRNPLAYDQIGNARDVNAMWPGAYEKH